MRLRSGGERGIRTLDTVSRIHAFQACAFNHSAISPGKGAPQAGLLHDDAARNGGNPFILARRPVAGGASLKYLSVMPIRRRDLLPLLSAPLLGQGRRRPRIAAVVTSYYFYSHADVILGRMMAGCSPNGKWRAGQCDVVSLYVHQIHERDMSADLEWRHGFKKYDTIARTLTLGGEKLAVDGVVFVGEHGTFPNNDVGQKMYPRYELFNEILDVYEKQGRALPTFFDKHLSYSWPKAKGLYERAKRLGVPWFAGSSIPLSVRVPHLVPAMGTKFERALSLGYGDLDAYGFHTIESLQCMVERRAGGETGVKAVETLQGDAAWRFLEDPAWRGLVQAGYDACPKKSSAPLRELVKKPVVFSIAYRDGLEAASILLNGAISDWAFAGAAGGRTMACKYGPAEKARTLPHFDGLVDNIETLFLTGKAPYPVERTLLTTGVLAHLFDSVRSGKRVETPELNVTYRAADPPYVQTA
jgi:hypothetical protein